MDQSLEEGEKLSAESLLALTCDPALVLNVQRGDDDLIEYGGKRAMD